MAPPDMLSISEVGEATGLQSSALRYYEKVGLIRPAARAGGRRHYDPSVLQRLAAIALLQEAGFTIAEVGQLLGAGTSQERWRSMAEQKLKEIDAHVARVAAARELLISALRCDCSGLDTCELVSARPWSPPEGASEAVVTEPSHLFVGTDEHPEVPFGVVVLC